MQTIDDIIKRAVEEANLKPVDTAAKPETVKSASENTVANQLYLLAGELEKLGDVQIGGTAPKEASSNDTLQQLAKTFVYQQSLKQASEERMDVSGDTDVEKLAAHVEAQSAYLDAFEKVANLKIIERYPLDVEPDKINRAELRHALGVLAGAGAGGAASVPGGYYIGTKLTSMGRSRLGMLAAGGLTLAGTIGGMVAGGHATRVPENLKTIEGAEFEDTDAPPHPTKWKKYPEYQEAVTVLEE